MATGMTWAGTAGDDTRVGGVNDDTVNGGAVHFRAVCGQEWGMRAMRHLALAAMVAAGLALAGCGGSSKKPTTPSEPADGMPPAQPEQTPVEKAKAAVTTANAAEMAAIAARMEADKQLAEAKKKGVYDIYSTGGDSSMVRANAEAVKAAKAAAEKALADAKAEKMKIDEALKALNALPADTPGLAAQKKVVMGQAEKAAAEIKAIEKTLTGGTDTFAGLISSVDTEAKIKDRAGEAPAGASETSSRPARRMLAALGPADTASASGGYGAKNSGTFIARPTGDLTELPSSVPPTKVIPNTPDDDNDPESTDPGRSMFYHKYDDGELPAGVMTWEQIAGAGNLVKKAFGTDNMDVDVLPLAGMPLSALTDSSGTTVTAMPTFTDGKAESQYYKGVKGTLYCQGTCNVEGGNLTGNLFFKAAGPSDDGNAGSYRYYWMEPANSHYTQYQAYVRYGYWLYETGNTTGVAVLANSPARDRGNLDTDAALPATATYKGNALGLSVLKTFTAGEHTGQKSAQFTADVTLNAKFGAAGARKLGGTVNNFMGNAVDPNWSVKLAEVTNDRFDVYQAATTGSSGGTAHDKLGLWSAEPFSQDGIGRPAGIMGNFNAHFSNGHAIGAFSTRMQTETTE